MLEYLSLIFKFLYNPKNINLILSFDSRMGLSKGKEIPWNLKGVNKWFTTNTEGNIIIMGTKTFTSLGFVPLKNRMNIVITKNPKKFSWLLERYENLKICSSMKEALIFSQKDYSCSPRGQIFIVGGNTLFNYCIKKYEYLIKYYYVSHIREDFNCDNFLSYIIGWKIAVETQWIYENSLYYKHKILIKLPNK